MEHTRLGYWIEEAGDVTLAPAPWPRIATPTSLIVGGGYTGMWTAWHAHQLDARGAHRPARVRTGLRARAERPQRRLLRGDVVLAGLDAGALGRRAGARRRPRRRGRGRPRSGLSAPARGSTPGSGAAATCRSPPRPPTTASGAKRWRPAVSSACRRRVQPVSPAEVAAPLRLAGLPRRGHLPTARRPSSPPAWRSAYAPADGGRGGGLRVLAGAPLPRGRRRGRGDHPDGRPRPRPRGVLAMGGAAEGRPAARSATGSRSPPPTSSSPSRSPTAREGRLDRAARRSPTAAPSSTTSAPPRTAGSPSAGAAAGSRWAPACAAAPSSTPSVVAAQRRPHARVLPGPRRSPPHPRLGRPDRRLARPTCR